MSPQELAQSVGAQITLWRAAKAWSHDRLADGATLPVQVIKDLEAGRGDLASLVTIAMALGFAHELWHACQPRPTTLDELERIEHARQDFQGHRGIR